MERGVCYSIPWSKDHGADHEAGKWSHFQVWSVRKKSIQTRDETSKPSCPRKCVCCSTWTRTESLHTTQKVTVPCKTCLLSICLIICATGLSVCRWRWWPVAPVYMHQRITLRFIFCLAMRYEYQLMLCLDDNQITSQKWQTMWGSCVKKSMSIPESSFELPRNARRTITNSEWLERKSRLAIEYSFMIQLGRKGRLRSFTHHGWSSCDQN